MKRKICYLKMYLNDNLGDDLFANIISQKYPDTKFVMVSYLNKKSKLKNIKVITGPIFRIVNKILKIITNKKITIENILAKKYKTALVLGGSMFIEGKSDDYKELSFTNDYYIIGTNFGPYKTEKYVEECKQIFKNAEYVCFREKDSYKIFEDIKGANIEVAPDIVFGLDISKVKITNRKRAVISIIDCKRKIGKEYEQSYENKMIDLSKNLIQKGYEVIFMSFCKKENDEIAIQRILEKLDEESKKSIDTYYYNGNIQEALNVLGDSSIIIGSRFHANILGLVLNKTIIPVIYSNKTASMLKDIDFKGKVIDIKKIDEFEVSDLKDTDLEYKIDISEYKEKAKNHFKGLKL